FSSISSSLILHLSDPRGQPDSCPAEQQVRQPGRHHRRQVTSGPQGHPEALQDEISEADENAGGHADECVAPARGAPKGTAIKTTTRHVQESAMRAYNC